MALHLIQSSPFSQNSLETCLDKIQPDDAVLLIHEAVYALLGDAPDTPSQFWALKDDALARGITQPAFAHWASIEDFVKLTEQHNPVISWG